MSSRPARPGPLLIDIEGTRLNADDRELLAHPAVGGAILFTRNYSDVAQLADLTAAMRAVRPNLLITADQEGGRVQRFREGFTRILPMRILGRLAERDLDAACHAAHEIAWLMAVELAQAGVDMPFAPVVDLDYGASGVIGDRAFAADAQTVGALVRAFSAGLTDAGSAATAKHFPGHGFVRADSHAELPVDNRSHAELAEDMAPYATLIGDGLASVMMAHVRYPQVDTLPASLSTHWIGDILRGEYGFEGCVFCDDLSMGGAAALGNYAERARLAQAAGCDYLPVCNNREAVLTLLDRVDYTVEAACARRERLYAACGHAPRAQRSGPPVDDARRQEALALHQRLAAGSA